MAGSYDTAGLEKDFNLISSDGSTPENGLHILDCNAIKRVSGTGNGGSTSSFRDDLKALPADFRLVRVGRNKEPAAGKGWFDADDFSPDDALRLNGSGPHAWGLKTGPASGGVLGLDLDAAGWAEDFQAVTGHPISDLPPTISWSSGKPGRSGHAFAVDREWWPQLRNRVPFTRPWREGDPLGKDGKPKDPTLWELRWDRHQSVLLGHHPETSGYRWLEGRSPREIPDLAPAPDWLLEHLLVQELPKVTQWVPSAEDAQRAVAMLQCLPAEHFTSYDDWLRVGMALHHTDDGLFSAWVDWCRAMSNFDEAECLAKWQSFGKGHKGRQATIATLHYLAKQHGYREPRHKERSQPPAQSEPTDPSQEAPLDAPFRVLGWRNGLDAVWVQLAGGLPGAVPLTKAGMQRLAPLEYWEAMFPDRRGPNWDQAISSVRDQAEALGAFELDRVRGSGVWLDQGRVVWHLGASLEVDGQPTALTEIDSAHTYASRPALAICPDVAPLTDAVGSQILDLFNRDMQWGKAGDGLLVAGHTVLGNVCAALDIRPGLQLTGPSMAGKSTTQRELINPLQANLAKRTSGATEAGVRQDMGADALPAVVDESEQENPKRREGHLNLVRLSFDGLKQLKGTPGGQAITYTMRSMITLIGINAEIPNPADRNRLIVIRPCKLEKEAWSNFLIKRDQLITVENGQRLIRRTVSNLRALLSNIRTFTAVVATQPGTDRTHQVMGALLAGAHHLTSTDAVDPDTAKAWLETVGWQGLNEATLEATSAHAEAQQCLDHLLGHTVQWKGSQTGSISVLELLQMVKGVHFLGDDYLAGHDAGDAIKALGRLGIKWDSERQLVVSNKCRVFDGSKWANGNHKNHLLCLDRADLVPAVMWFPGMGAQRAVSLSLQLEETKQAERAEPLQTEQLTVPADRLLGQIHCSARVLTT